MTALNRHASMNRDSVAAILAVFDSGRL